MTFKIFFFFLNRKRCQKTLQKMLKNAHKKVISKTSLTNMSKSEKSAYFRHVFDNNFFLVRFFKTFSFKCAGNGSKKENLF
jgi:hypothetical protein